MIFFLYFNHAIFLRERCLLLQSLIIQPIWRRRIRLGKILILISDSEIDKSNKAFFMIFQYSRR